MESIGAEVGQKMRSAIKAKLLELNCYVDDELPDYVMVMVANKRSKNQMNEDLNLFLSNKTSIFVNWLHIVLKKLKEVSVTNPEVYKKVAKRKLTDRLNIEVEDKKFKNSNDIKNEDKCENSLTDNLPITSTQLDNNRRITIVKSENIEIGPFSGVKSCSKEELEDIEKRIKSVKNRLGDLVEEDENTLKHQKEMPCVLTNILTMDKQRTVELQEDDTEISKESEINDSEELLKIPHADVSTNSIKTATDSLRNMKHTPITFENESTKKKVSILDRLGEKTNTVQNQKTIKFSEVRKEEEQFLGYYDQHLDKHEATEDTDNFYNKKESQINRNRHPIRKTLNINKRENFKPSKLNIKKPAKRSALSRLEVMSKVHVPLKEEQAESDEISNRGVKSVVHVKPRVIPADVAQPNKNLLLKAVAEAEKSIIQASKQRINRVEKLLETSSKLEPKSAQNQVHLGTQLRNTIMPKSPINEIYMPKSLHSTSKEESSLISKEESSYISSAKRFPGESGKKINNNEMLNEDELLIMINTENTISKPKISNEGIRRRSVKERLQEKKSPSPIIFDKVLTEIITKPNMSHKVSPFHSTLSTKIKERCKYWPKCRMGEKCEFVHPSSTCDIFPNCKFGDKCVYLHPTCKFGSSCTKRNCPFSHVIMLPHAGTRNFTHKINKTKSSQLQICKYFPHCTDPICRFYHPHTSHPYKYEKYCQGSTEGTYSQPVLSSNLSWSLK